MNFLTKIVEMDYFFSFFFELFNLALYLYIYNKVYKYIKMSNVEIANDFLKYVSENMNELKKAVKKNITNDNDLFDDGFNETIIKVYNSIVKNGTIIDNYKQYFFLACKFTFIYRQNKKRKEEAQAIRDYFDLNDDFLDDDFDEEERYCDIVDTIDKIKEDVTENLGEYYAEIYFTYMQLKSTQSISYKKLAAEKGISTRRVSQIIGMVKEYIKNNPTLQSYKSVLNKED